MNAPRSAAHAGSRAPSVSQLAPATLVSKSSSLVSATLGRIKQDVFPRGLTQIFPAQRLSCHGTRTETCMVGKRLAPTIISIPFCKALALLDVSKKRLQK